MANERRTARSPARTFFSPATIIVVCALGLTLLGLTVLFSASAAFRNKAGVEVPYLYLQKQFFGVMIATVVCIFVSRLDLDYVRRYAWWIAGAALLLLAIVLIPGIGMKVKGSSRWLGYGPVRLQVSELGKFALVFCLAHYLALNQMRIGELRRGFVLPLLIVGGFAGLVLCETDMGTAALMIFVGFALLFLAGARWRYLLPTIGLALGGFVVIVLHSPNRLRRIMAFLDPEGTRLSAGYQNWQALLAFASGGIDGAGLGQGRQQLNYLPEAHTDFIFSIIGEELGLWFTLGVVLTFILMLVAGLFHLRRAPNLFQYLLVAGCLMLMCVQAIVNLGVVTALLPNKGMPLPFISAGLSNLMLMGLVVGIIINTQRNWGRAVLPDNAGGMREVLA
ncbi:putative lipid II flippase FtsW [Opitutus sp. ER46]|uniref:putative lipid II flippase FtsW n=1 Tax=Opitutus sp. ER46 TaxID=2161864 RepID=UPI000D313D17|nr:putative lipid II flippase FtsW [Opitutus sp. ER46]PTX90797.1 putative lipid II flippase FtsW [Opitutus sp. ER46]